MDVKLPRDVKILGKTEDIERFEINDLSGTYNSSRKWLAFKYSSRRDTMDTAPNI